MPTAQLELLDIERSRLLAAVDGVAAANRHRRPAADKWSVAEILEHLAIVEQSVANLIAVRGCGPLPENPETPVPLDGAAVARLRSRELSINVPDRMRPSGSMTAAAAIQALDASRAALLDAVKKADPVALDHQSYVHAVVGRLVLRDWIAFVAHHEARHAEQITEIGTALGGDRV
jgi:hypothetical protein